MVKTVGKIKDLLTEENLAFIAEFGCEPSKSVDEGSKLFGAKIECKPTTVVWPETKWLHNMVEANAPKPAEGFTMSYDRVVVETNSKTGVSILPRETNKNLL